MAAYTRLAMETWQKLENFPSHSYIDHLSAVEKEWYGHKLQVLVTCDPHTAPAAVFQPLKTPCQSSTSVTFACTLWRIPHLTLLPGWKLIKVRTVLCIFDLDGIIMLPLGKWRANRINWLTLCYWHYTRLNVHYCICTLDITNKHKLTDKKGFPNHCTLSLFEANTTSKLLS